MSKFLGREPVQRPACPFCGIEIERPKELSTRMPTEMPVGSCSCGAVYAYDITGHNLGTAMIDALVFGCNGDWDLAWGLLPGEDYVEKQVENYDIESHLIVRGGIYGGRRIAGTLYFILMHKDVREVTEEGTRKRLERATNTRYRSSGTKRGKKAYSKKDVEKLVEAYEVPPLLDFAAQDKRIIRDLQRLIYTPDKLLQWRATDILGKVSAIIARYDPGFISRLLQRLFTAVADTAASNWGCLDAIGDIIGNSPDQFGAYAPQLYQYASDRALLPEILRALGKIGAAKPDLLRKKAFHFIPLLQDPDKEIRGYAVILLGTLGATEAKNDLARLQGDSTPIEIYRDGNLERSTIGQLANEAFEKL